MTLKINLSTSLSSSPEKTSPTQKSAATLSLFENLENLAQDAKNRQTPPAKRPFSNFDITDSNQERSTNLGSPSKKLKSVESEVADAQIAGLFSQAFSTPPPALIRKSHLSKSAPTSPHEKLYSEIKSSKSLKIQNIQTTLNFFAKGTFMASYSIEAKQSLISDVPNEQVLLKLYHGEKTKFSSKLFEYMKSSVANYHAVQELGVSVAKIYNIETALTDAYFLTELIPHPINIKEEHQIEQITAIFQKSFQAHVLMDLAYGNLRVRDDGGVTLVDFVEKPFEFENKQKLRMFAIQFLKSWCKTVETKVEAEKLLSRLTGGLEKQGFDPDWNKAALEESFFEVSF